jgi:hypothetical protein
MGKHNRKSSSLTVVIELMQFRRLLPTVTGTIFSDTDRDGRLDAGELGIAFSL